MKNILSVKNLKIIILGLVFITAVSITVVLLTNKTKSPTADSSQPEGQIDTEKSTSLYSLITEVNCEGTLVFDFKGKEELLVSDFTRDQRLNLIFRYLEINDKLKDSVSKDDFDESVRKVFGPNFTESFNITNFKYKDKSWSASGKTISSKEANKCEENSVVTKNFSYSPNEIGIELGKTNNDKLYNLAGDLIGTFSNNEELNTLLDDSTAYYYKYDFNGEDAYLVRVTPIIKVKLDGDITE